MRKNICIFLVCCICTAYGAKLIEGNDTTKINSFTFPILAHAYSDVTGQFFVGARNSVTDNTYALAVANAAGLAFSPLATPTLTTVNGIANTPHPLLGQAVLHLSLISDALPTQAIPAVVTTQTPGIIHTLLSGVLSTPTLNDANGSPTDGISALATGLYYVFAAVQPNGGTFGTAGGGITYAILSANNENVFNISPIDAQTGLSGNRAVLLDPTVTSVIGINGTPLTAMATVIDMHFDRILQRLYMVIQGTGGAGASDGVRALVVGRIVNGILVLEAAAPQEVFTGLTHIVGATGSNASVSLSKVRTMHTSTRLQYVIVAGDVGTIATTGNKIYALPLVNRAPLSTQGDMSLESTLYFAAADPLQGLLARYDAIPEQAYMNVYPNVLRARGITTQATTAAHVLANTDKQAIVGAGPLPMTASDTIQEMLVINDAVYVAVGSTYSATSAPGLYHSQALFDAYGRIAGWTAWQRACGSDQQLFGFGLEITSGNFWTMQAGSADTIQTVSITQWGFGGATGLLNGTTSDAAVGLSQQLKNEFTQENGGIHNIFTFDRNTESFASDSADPLNQLSVLIATGRGKVVLVETGRNAAAHIFTPNTGDFATNKQIFTDGTLATLIPNSSTKIISISGGVLNTLGPITSAAISRTRGVTFVGSEFAGLLFVGGVEGTAVLFDSATQGGWLTSLGLFSPYGLHTGFIGLTTTMAFARLGSYKNVRKLICDGNFLYALTPTQVGRMYLFDLTSTSIFPDFTTIATPRGIGLSDEASFSDMIISGKLALIATNEGLMRIANGKDISTSTQVTQNDWTRVPLPEGLPNVSRLYPLSAISRTPMDVYAGGMVYAASGATPFNQTRIHRINIESTQFTPVADSTVTPINDQFIKNVTSFLVEFGSYRNYIATDGALLFNVADGNQNQGPLFQSYMLYKTADKFGAKLTVKPVKNLPVSSLSTIRQPLRSESGSWLIGGDFGLLVNE